LRELRRIGGGSSGSSGSCCDQEGPTTTTTITTYLITDMAVGGYKDTQDILFGRNGELVVVVPVGGGGSR